VTGRARIGRFSFGWPYLIFAAVLLLRLVNLAHLANSPFLLPSRGDMHFYNDWAQRILEGGLEQRLAFYGLPGYAYLLALLYRIFGYNPFLPGLLQAALDAGTAVLIYLITLRIFSQRPASETGDAQQELCARIAGGIAAIGWAFFVPAQAYAVILMPTAWFIFVFWFVVWRITERNDAPRLIECFSLGLLIGIFATAIANILLLVPLVLAALIIKPKIDNSQRWRIFTLGAVLLIVGLVFGTAPCWVHNYFVARDPVFLSAHSGINFWIGNNPDANGYPRFPPGLHAGQAAMLQDSITQAESAAGRSLKHSEVSAYWSAKAKAYIAAHFSDWLKLLAVKLRNFWSAFQYDDLSVITNLREQGVIFPGLYFGLVAGLAIPGMFFAAAFSPRSRWIIAAVLLSLIGLLGVFITERYRLVAAPGLLLFAAFGLSIFWESCNSGRIKTVAVYLTLLTGSMIVVSWPQRAPSLWALDAYNSGWQALESNNLALVEKKLAIAYAYVPTNAETNFALGNLRLAQSRTEEASLFYHATLRIDPHHKGALNNLGVISFEESNFAQARQLFEEALAQAPRDAKTHYLLAKTFYAESNQAAAREAIGRALSLNPRQQEFIDLKNKIDAMSP
jgi:tetratricopeptide (TPR) repeat protein